MGKKYSGPERRKYHRLEEKLPLLYQTTRQGDVKKTTTKNIGGGGLSFEAEIYVPPTATIEIQVNKPIDDGLKAILPIHANAKVVWIKHVGTGKYRLGLEFVDIKEKHRAEIIREVEEKLKDE